MVILVQSDKSYVLIGMYTSSDNHGYPESHIPWVIIITSVKFLCIYIEIVKLDISLSFITITCIC